jgi:uncharacterized membrane protein YbhN (UPF0104 family)
MMTDEDKEGVISARRRILKGVSPARRRLAFILVGVVALAAVILVSVHSSEISGFAAQVTKLEPGWFLAAALAQLATYGCVAHVWRRVLTRAGTPLPFFRLYPLSLAKLFADQALPSGGVSGAVFFLHALGQRGVPQKTAFTVFIFATVSFFTAFLAATMISLFAIAAAEKAPPLLAESIALFSAVIFLFALLGFLYFVFRPDHPPVWLQKTPWADKALAFIDEAFRQIASKRRLFFEVTIIQLVVRMIDGATLYFIFLAIGAPIDYGVAFVGVVIGSVAATIGPIPMGLGAFETGMMTSVNVFGVPIETALTATLVYRGLSLWLPLIPGFFVIQREMLQIKSSDYRGLDFADAGERQFEEDQN